MNLEPVINLPLEKQDLFSLNAQSSTILRYMNSAAFALEGTLIQMNTVAYHYHILHFVFTDVHGFQIER